MEAAAHIRTPDQRLRVFVSSTLQELAPERVAAREAISRLHLSPVLFEMGARPHPPRDLYRAYVAQSDVFVGVYWQRYGWVAPSMAISGLEDEYDLSSGKPRLIYVKDAADREPRMADLIGRIMNDGAASFRPFKATEELKELVVDDLAHLLTERFARSLPTSAAAELRRSAPPIERGAMVGRTREMTDLASLIATDDVGLVTLTGPGGSGKTRLAVHLAHAVTPDFPDGVFYVPLASVVEAGAVTAAIASALEVPASGEAGGSDPSERLFSFLRNKRALLVLDNFEQVIGAAPEIARMLATCGRIKILITSRQALRVRGERELPVPPLAVRVDAGVAPATELFERRAREVRPDFALTGDNTDTVTEICRRLDGLPLAIELAASRSRVLSPQAMLARLDRSLSLLTGGAKDLPERQRTLRATLEWSHDLLTEHERTTFRRLGAFLGGFTLEKAGLVTADAHILEDLESLVDKSLLMRSEQGAEMRFAMLETIAEYSRERLAASGEDAEVRRTHARVFMEFASTWQPLVTGARRREAQAAIAAEIGNLHAALTYCAASPVPADTTLGIRLTTALHNYWYFNATLTEARHWLDELTSKGHPIDEATSAMADWGRGMTAMAQANVEDGLKTLLDCIARLRDTGQDQYAGWATVLSGLGLRVVGESDRGITFLHDAIALFQSVGDAYGEALAHDFLAEAYAHDHQFALAMKEAEEAVERFAAIPAPWGVANTWTTMAAIAARQGDSARARQLFAAAVAMLEEPGDRWGRACAMLCLAATVLQAGETTEARALFEEALVEWRSVGSTIAMAACLGGIGACAIRDGRTDFGARLLALAPDHANPATYRVVIGLEKSGALLEALREARESIGDGAPRVAGPAEIDAGVKLVLASR